MARVQFDHVYKRFNKVEIVHDINLDIRDKEWSVPLAVGRVPVCVWWPV